MEKQLLKKLLSFEFYTRHKGKVLREFFPGSLAALYDTIVHAHDKYKVDIELPWLRKIHHELNPALPKAARSNLANLLDDIAHEEDVPDAVIADILSMMHTKEKARQIVEAGLEVVNGVSVSPADTIASIADIVNSVDLSGAISENYEVLDFDLDGFLEGVSEENLYPFRLDTLREHVYGAGPGNFIILFARPEAGKTTYACYETAGYLSNGLKVAYFANEEPAFRVYLRIICSALNMTVADIKKDVKAAKAAFAPMAENLKMVDCVGMDISEAESYIADVEPNVVILDQLDKFRIKGEYSRTDERLGAIYVHAREIAKRHKNLVWAVSQASANAEGLARLDYAMLANSKTSKGAEADLAIGIGHNKQLNSRDDARHFYVSKNKINSWKNLITVMIEPHTASFRV